MIGAWLSIRTKIAVMMTGILAVIAIGIYLYFPARLHEQIVDSVVQKAAALTHTTALGVAEDLQQGNRTAVAAALTGIRSNPDLAYFILTDQRGAIFASFNELIARDSQYATIEMSPLQRPQRVLQAGSSTASPVGGDIFTGTSAEGTIAQTMVPVRYRGREVGRLYTGMSLASATNDARRSRAAVALATLLAFALGTAAVFVMSAVITTPLKRIVETAEGIAGGDYSKRAAVHGDDEVGQLARSFNDMVDKIADAYAAVETSNRNLETRVAERTLELRDSEERYRLLFERNLAAVYMATDDGRLIDCNDACAKMFGYESRQEFLDHGTIEYLHPHERDSILRRLREEGAVTNVEVELRQGSGGSCWALENVRRIVPADGGPAVLEGILLDISDRKRAEEDIAFKAYHDGLTNLPNRALFLDRLDIALAQARRHNTMLAVLFLDLDDMKSINDTFGHPIGDAVLRATGERLKETVRAGDTVARVGGDEFLILLEIQNTDEATAVARKILGRISEPLEIENDELFLTTSIGVSIFPGDGEDAQSLIRHADGAMYRVKENGGNELTLSGGTSRKVLGRLTLEEQLRSAIDRDEFELYYQPQVFIGTRALSGAEALVRWRRPDGQLVGPMAFMTVCEQSGLITALGELVLRKACAQMVAWQKLGTAPLRMGVNVSARQFFQRDFTGMVERVLSESGMAPLRLELELTESVAMQTTDRALTMLQRLREIGIAIAIDDFGTGQSSLSYLKRFPVDTVKIDKSFVADLITGENDEWIITAILMLANHLGLRTVAEGVETEQQSEFLLGHDCREIQGYLIDQPLEAATFAARYLKPHGGAERATRVLTMRD
jgi:diguanylate cyclase (GGDEF)-like protein/PAS domain S-box-containing protein